MNTAVGQKAPRAKAVRGVDSNFLCDRLASEKVVCMLALFSLSVAPAILCNYCGLSMQPAAAAFVPNHALRCILPHACRVYFMLPLFTDIEPVSSPESTAYTFRVTHQTHVSLLAFYLSILLARA